MSAHEGCIGRRRIRHASLDPWPVNALRATLDFEPAGLEDDDILPPLWHWLYFLDTAARRRIGPDGHARNGDFLPLLPQPRRMFAGAHSHFHAPLRLGVDTELTETVLDAQNKRGRQGDMVLISVGYEYRQQGKLCVEERRSFVYLPQATAPTPAPANAGTEVPTAAWSLDLPVDEVLLFRYSALTFNSHRIHYDTPYATTTEGYPRLVVQGPLTATLLMEMGRRQLDAPCTEFEFRASAPLFVGDTLHLRGQPEGDHASLCAYRRDGQAALQATLRWRPTR